MPKISRNISQSIRVNKRCMAMISNTKIKQNITPMPEIYYKLSEARNKPKSY